MSWFLINADQHSQAQPQVGELNEVLGKFLPMLRESHTQRGDPTPVIAGLAQQVPNYQCNNNGKWIQAPVEPHGRVGVKVDVCQEATSQLGLQTPQQVNPTKVIALADSGAQICMADYSLASKMNLAHQLFTPTMQVSVANNAGLNIMGAMFLNITAPNGSTSSQMVYFAKNVKEFFLSKSATRDLRIITDNFPIIVQHSSQLGAVSNYQQAHERVGVPSKSYNSNFKDTSHY